MTNMLWLIARHGYALTFSILLAEAVGFPVPAALALVVAGAAVATHVLSAPAVILAALVALLLGDGAMFCLAAIAAGDCSAFFAAFL